MKPGAGKSKGGDFERHVCKRLSLWLTQGRHDDCLWRSAMSGGRATIQLTEGVVNRTQGGDISAISLEGHELISRCLIECKFYADLNIVEGLVKGTGNLIAFWRRVVADARTYGKQPVLIARQNRLPTLAIVASGFRLFDEGKVPVLSSAGWNADFYLFEDAMAVRVVFKRGSRAR